MDRKLEYSVMNNLRWPLVFFVILAHVAPDFPNTYADIHWHEFNGYDLFFLSRKIISSIIPRFVVPCFAFMSGYLYFLNVKKFDMHTYVEKQKRRHHSLFYPLILWNLIAWVVYILNSFVTKGSAETIQMIKDTFGLSLFYNFRDTACPVDMPLWFMVYLIGLAYLTPVIYFIFKKTKWCGLLAFFIMYLAKVSYVADMTTFFFLLGTFMGIYKMDFFGFCRKYFVPLILASVVLMLVYIPRFGDSSHLYEAIYRLFFLASSMSCMGGMTKATEKYNLNIKDSGRKCMFFYGVHCIWFIYWFRDIMNSVIPEWGGATWYMLFVSYFTQIAVTIAWCFLLYHVMNRICLKVVDVLTGGR